MFSFRLALKLGKTVRQLLTEIDSHELSEWMAFDQLSPIDSDLRNEIAVGKVTSILYNVNRDENTSEAKDLAAFVPTWGAEYRETAENERFVESIENGREAAIARIRGAFNNMRGT